MPVAWSLIRIFVQKQAGCRSDVIGEESPGSEEQPYFLTGRSYSGDRMRTESAAERKTTPGVDFWITSEEKVKR